MCLNYAQKHIEMVALIHTMRSYIVCSAMLSNKHIEYCLTIHSQNFNLKLIPEKFEIHPMRGTKKIIQFHSVQLINILLFIIYKRNYGKGTIDNEK